MAHLDPRTYHHAFIEATEAQPKRHVLTTDPTLLPEAPMVLNTISRRLTFLEAQQLAVEWAASGAHVTIRTATADYAYPPFGGTGKPVDVLAFEAFDAIGAREFVDAMCLTEVEADEELPF